MAEVMTRVTESGDTADLQLDSLELDIKTLQRNREEDRKEFQDFQVTVKRTLSRCIFFWTRSRKISGAYS